MSLPCGPLSAHHRGENRAHVPNSQGRRTPCGRRNDAGLHRSRRQAATLAGDSEDRRIQLIRPWGMQGNIHAPIAYSIRPTGFVLHSPRARGGRCGLFAPSGGPRILPEKHQPHGCLDPRPGRRPLPHANDSVVEGPPLARRWLRRRGRPLDRASGPSRRMVSHARSARHRRRHSANLQFASAARSCRTRSSATMPRP